MDTEFLPTYEKAIQSNTATLPVDGTSPLGGTQTLRNHEQPPKYTLIDGYLRENYRKSKKNPCLTLLGLILSIFVFISYLLVVLGCVTKPLKNLYFVHFDIEHASYVEGVRRYGYGYGVDDSRLLTQLDTSSATDSKFAAMKRYDFSSEEVTEKLSSRSTLNPSKTIPFSKSSVSNPSLLLPTKIPYLETYMGYFGALDDNATYVSGKDLFLDQSYFAGVWVWGRENYGFYESTYLPLDPGLNISQKMNEFTSTSHLNMVGLNYLPDEFPQRSSVLHWNKVFKALQPLSAVSLFAAFIFLFLSFQVIPTKFTLAVSLVSLCIALAFNVLYTVVSTSFSSNLSKAFCFKEVPVRRGTTSIILLWVSFAVQVIVTVLRILMFLTNDR